MILLILTILFMRTTESDVMAIAAVPLATPPTAPPAIPADVNVHEGRIMATVRTQVNSLPRMRGDATYYGTRKSNCERRGKIYATTQPALLLVETVSASTGTSDASTALVLLGAEMGTSSVRARTQDSIVVAKESIGVCEGESGCRG
jgi:hypothetical protein